MASLAVSTIVIGDGRQIGLAHHRIGIVNKALTPNVEKRYSGSATLRRCLKIKAEECGKLAATEIGI